MTVTDVTRAATFFTAGPSGANLPAVVVFGSVVAAAAVLTGRGAPIMLRYLSAVGPPGKLGFVLLLSELIFSLLFLAGLLVVRFVLPVPSVDDTLNLYGYLCVGVIVFGSLIGFSALVLEALMRSTRRRSG
jgi:hypothetical protein